VDIAAQSATYLPEQVAEQPRIADAGQARTAISRSYSASLQDAGLEGRVEVAFVVDADGSVDASTIRVINTPAPALGKAAEAAVARIRFRPAQKDGQAVRCHAGLAVVYQRGM
jgi:TonB family protein